MIATAAEDEESAFEKAYSGLRGWVDCFEKAELKGIVTGGGIADPNDASFNDDVLFGENWNNHDIDVKTRSIITVVALI